LEMPKRTVYCFNCGSTDTFLYGGRAFDYEVFNCRKCGSKTIIDQSLNDMPLPELERVGHRDLVATKGDGRGL